VTLSGTELRRYARQVVLPGFGTEGQARLRASSVLIVGLGGLGSPAALYLAAAGVGRIGLVDADVVDESNLHRQILHGTRQVGISKTDSARARLAGLNPHVTLELHPEQFTAANAVRLVRQYDVILDGTDNFGTRYAVNDACVLTARPNVHASVHRLEGQLSVFATHGGPCYRCLFPVPPEDGTVPNCAQGGVLGVVPGILGTAQAAEAIKLIAGVGEPLVGRLFLLDVGSMRSRTVTLARNPECPVCGAKPRVRAAGDGIVADDELAAHYLAGCTPPAPPTLDFVISPQELAERRAAGEPLSLIDVREEWEYAIARLEGSQLVPLGTLAGAEPGIARHGELIVLCHHGVRSARAAEYLRSRGITGARSLAGGIDRWSVEIDSTVPRY
jgi:molybdopterin/thiamine biosynthesis adenylyltransferase/rhodanese-related sulfurtransferase